MSDFGKTPLFNQDNDMSPVILVDRGNCTFVTKVRNIEQLGVKMAIIGDSFKEDTENLIMADDGTGHSINIPSFIIRFTDSNKIKAVLAKN
jgi:extracellular elastinolytic metalloproteinase